MTKQNPTPVVMMTVNEFGECDKWYNLKDDVQFDVLIIWTHRGMVEQMFDYIDKVVTAGYQVDIILPTPAMKYTIKTGEDITDFCLLMEMVYG